MPLRMKQRPTADRREGYAQQATKPVWLCRCKRCRRTSERFQDPRCCNRMIEADGGREICRGELVPIEVVRFTDASDHAAPSPALRPPRPAYQNGRAQRVRLARRGAGMGGIDVG